MDERRARASFAKVWKRFEQAGMLLRSDARLPSVASLVAGAPIAGSWWSHPLAHPIYDVCQQLEHHPDVILVKLVAAKVTYLHRPLWAALLGAAGSGAAWQTAGLSAPARALAGRVAARGVLRMDELRAERGAVAKARGGAPRELEARLLVYSEDVHTERGAHAKRLESWEHWSRRIGRLPACGAAEGEAELEAAVRRYAGPEWRDALLPWSVARAARAARSPRRPRSGTSSTA